MKYRIKTLVHSLHYKLLAVTVILTLIAPWATSQALAQNVAMGTCTFSSDYDIPTVPSGTGLFSQIQTTIEGELTPLAGNMFNTIRADSNVVGAIQAAVTLYIAIYGLAFTFGIINVTAFDLMIRLAKIGVVVTLLGTSAWTNFSSVIGGGVDANGNATGFFAGGTDEIIGVVTSVVVGGVTTANSKPFDAMDQAITMVISPKMAATMIAAFTTGPYGPAVGLILVLGLGSFLKSLMNAMWVYIMALVMRTFLFALAPLFLPCILFVRTKHLFDGWLNQIINACLQPIFLFTFFSFFVVLIQACLQQLFQTPVCWTSMAGAVRGAPFEGQLWRFAIWDCNQSQWVPYDNVWGFAGPQNTAAGCSYPVNPIGITLPLTLWIIADLATRFNSVVIEIAKDISQASTDLRLGAEKIGDWVSSAGAKGGGEGGAPAKAPVSPASARGTGVSAAPPSSSPPPTTPSGTPSENVRDRQKNLPGQRNTPK